MTRIIRKSRQGQRRSFERLEYDLVSFSLDSTAGKLCEVEADYRARHKGLFIVIVGYANCFITFYIYTYVRRKFKAEVQSTFQSSKEKLDAMYFKSILL